MDKQLQRFLPFLFATRGRILHGSPTSGKSTLKTSLALFGVPCQDTDDFIAACFPAWFEVRPWRNLGVKRVDGQPIDAYRARMAITCGVMAAVCAAGRGSELAPYYVPRGKPLQAGWPCIVVTNQWSPKFQYGVRLGQLVCFYDRDGMLEDLVALLADWSWANFTRFEHRLKTMVAHTAEITLPYVPQDKGLWSKAPVYRLKWSFVRSSATEWARIYNKRRTDLKEYPVSSAKASIRKLREDGPLAFRHMVFLKDGEYIQDYIIPEVLYHMSQSMAPRIPDVTQEFEFIRAKLDDPKG